VTKDKTKINKANPGILFIDSSFFPSSLRGNFSVCQKYRVLNRVCQERKEGARKEEEGFTAIPFYDK